MSDILAIISPIYIAILLGYAATRMGLFSKADMRVFGKFVMSFALPALIFNAVSQRPIAEVLNASYMAAYLSGSLLILAAGLFCARRLAGMNRVGSTFAAMGVSCSNSGYIGLPILLLTMPEMASVALAMNVVIENVVMIPLLLMLAESARQGGRPTVRVFAETVARVARMPLVLGLLAGLAVSLLGLSLPSPVARTVTLFAQATGALSLFVIGGTLVGLPLRGMGMTVLPIAIGKLVGHPLSVLLAASLLPWIGMAPVAPSLLAAGLVMAAVPMLGIYPILAQAYGLAERSAGALLVTTALSFLTLSAALWLLRHPV
ncbi:MULTISPECIES: AEC family transporter [unclassified Massilia]|uniref:AEC family transporter n=1 Tax=unclassified Massilia TaxID=2609279 RepID=UPI00177F21C1|nr:MULTISPECIES: AEC family transporter [unclassified Massilia]MBD8532916.1 AEC family transporter [Massilia sp. CFBP 13647]MBD8676320.1 AEC family transporter [Massilia sp. CFBP 13721]